MSVAGKGLRIIVVHWGGVLSERTLFKRAIGVLQLPIQHVHCGNRCCKEHPWPGHKEEVPDAQCSICGKPVQESE